MEFKNNFENIRKSIKHNDNQTEKSISLPDDSWYQYDSPLSQFGGTFVKSLSKEYTEYLDKKIYVDIEEIGMPFKKYIEDTLARSKNKKLYAIEFGGPGSNLFSGFKNGFFDKTTGVCLGDTRHPIDSRRDDLNNHSIIESDILHANNKELYNEISQKLGVKKVDLIVSRMQGPLRKIERNPAIMNALVKKWYSLLNENGILFAQFEYFDEHNPNMEQKYQAIIQPEAIRDSEIHVNYWAEEIKKKFPDVIDIQLGRGVLRLHKKEGAPEELPTFDDMFSEKI